MSGGLQLILPSGQSAAPGPAIEGAIDLAKTLGARLTVSIGKTSANAPTHWLAHEYAVVHVAEYNTQLAAEAERLKTEALRAAGDAGVTARALELVNGVVGSERAIVLAARTHDLTILGIADQSPDTRRIAEELLFDSGRPLLLLPLSRPFRLDLDTIAIAWDHSEPASRLIAEAMPLITRANRVLVFSVRGAKKLPQADAAAELAAYLESHNLAIEWETVESDDRARGRFIMEKAVARGAGLLMMGAYATVPAQEYLLGGVTVSVLNEPLLPILMAN